MEERFSLKDALFNRQKIELLASQLQAVYTDFPGEIFVKTVVRAFPDLELKQRITWITENLRQFLPKSFREAMSIILEALPPPLDSSKTDNDFGDFIYAPYNEFIARYGCSKEDLEFSLAALREVTKRFSAEDAIRYFINAFPDETFAKLSLWSQEPNYHVRRLVSEGTRPKLPWSQKIRTPVEKPLPLLDTLFADPTRYVTRSVANHMNDISKVNPDLVLQTLERWETSGKQNPKEMEFIVKHSLRTLVKKGHPGAISFLKYSTDPEITVDSFVVKNDTVKMGNSLEFSVAITAFKDERLLVDYKIRFQGKNGGMKNSKVFKLKQYEIRKGETVRLEKKHKMVEKMTTRTLYPGDHMLEVMVNGRVVGEKRFTLAT